MPSAGERRGLVRQRPGCGGLHPQPAPPQPELGPGPFPAPSRHQVAHLLPRPRVWSQGVSSSPNWEGFLFSPNWHGGGRPHPQTSAGSRSLTPNCNPVLTPPPRTSRGSETVLGSQNIPCPTPALGPGPLPPTGRGQGPDRALPAFPGPRTSPQRGLGSGTTLNPEPVRHSPFPADWQEVRDHPPNQSQLSPQSGTSLSRPQASPGAAIPPASRYRPAMDPVPPWTESAAGQ